MALDEKESLGRDSLSANTKRGNPLIKRSDDCSFYVADAVAVRSDKVLYINVALSRNSVLPQSPAVPT